MKMIFATTVLARLRGLAALVGFDGVLVLAPCRDVHTFSMAGPIDIAFVSLSGVVLESHCGVPPRRRLRNRRAALVLERFESSDPWFEAGDHLVLSSRRRPNGDNPLRVTSSFTSLEIASGRKTPLLVGCPGSEEERSEL